MGSEWEATYIDTAQLVERCRQGDDLAWERLVRQYQGRVYALAYHYVHDPDEARDLAQEAFLPVYEQLGKFDGPAFLPWLLRLTRNLCIDRLRRRKSRPPTSDVPVEGDSPAVAAPGPSPEQAWLRDAATRLAYTALAKMSGPARELIVLKEIVGLSLKEVAATLRVPVGTVKSQADRARVELAQRVLELELYRTRFLGHTFALRGRA